MLDQPFVMNLKVKRRASAVWALRLPGKETDCSSEELLEDEKKKKKHTQGYIYKPNQTKTQRAATIDSI